MGPTYALSSELKLPTDRRRDGRSCAFEVDQSEHDLDEATVLEIGASRATATWRTMSPLIQHRGSRLAYELVSW